MVGGKNSKGLEKSNEIVVPRQTTRKRTRSESVKRAIQDLNGGKRRGRTSSVAQKIVFKDDDSNGANNNATVKQVNVKTRNKPANDALKNDKVIQVQKGDKTIKRKLTKGNKVPICPEIKIVNHGPLPDFSQVVTQVAQELQQVDFQHGEYEHDNDGIMLQVEQDDLDYDEEDFCEITSSDEDTANGNAEQNGQRVTVVGNAIASTSAGPQQSVVIEEERLMLVFKNIMQKLLSEQLADGGAALIEALKQNPAASGNNDPGSKGDGNYGNNTSAKRVVVCKQCNELIKLPSDTTIYAPALVKRTIDPVRVIGNFGSGSKGVNAAGTNIGNNVSVDEISNFVEAVHLETQHNQ